MLNKEQIKKAYFEAKMDTIARYPEMAKFFDLIERKGSIISAAETPLKSEEKEDSLIDDH